MQRDTKFSAKTVIPLTLIGRLFYDANNALVLPVPLEVVLRVINLLLIMHVVKRAKV